MADKRKFYVVWTGEAPGVYDSWEECKLQINGYPGAQYKSFDSQEDAVAAFRGDPREQLGILRQIARHRNDIVNYEAFPEIHLDGIAVDGACSGNPGLMEYRGVLVGTGEELFHVGPLPDGTNNVAEYLALIHALALLDRKGDKNTVVYSDSRTALSWLKRFGHNSKLEQTPKNPKIHEMLARADRWIQSHPAHNAVIKWDTDKWGEIPADFGRK